MSFTNSLLDIEAVDLEVLAGFEEAQEEGEPDFVVELIDLYLVAPRLFTVIREGLANATGLLQNAPPTASVAAAVILSTARQRTRCLLDKCAHRGLAEQFATACE